MKRCQNIPQFIGVFRVYAAWVVSSSKSRFSPLWRIVLIILNRNATHGACQEQF
jgi:hypothetical protein